MMRSIKQTQKWIVEICSIVEIVEFEFVLELVYAVAVVQFIDVGDVVANEEVV